MSRGLVAAIVLFAAAASPAFAQSASSASELIAASATPAEFIDASTSTQARVKHRASGVICAYGSAARPRTLEYKDGVFGCTTIGDAGYNLLVTQTSGLAVGTDAATAENEAAVTALTAGVAGIQLVERRKDSFRVGGAPTRMTIMTAQINGAPLRIVIRSTVVGRWVVVQIVGSPPEKAADADQRAEQMLRDAVASVVR